ncbi:PH domain-containing protein [Ruminococcus sp. 5_1_39BFAA]|uniref:PH domain-containing protein n=1 Tax=Ruminococcus sp. 5_1_39BFAA TaxID=457412 RepID=UPI0035646CC6
MKFQGKIAVWFWAIIIVANGMLIYDIIFSGDNLAAGLVGGVIFNVVFLPMVIRNYVFVSEDVVKVYFGILKDSVQIRDIVEVYATHNPIASSAASLDRIVIKGRRNELMCSVREKEKLFEELKKRNAEILFR